jgi:hypothetical protein
MDTYWRMGYNYPVQLALRALASAPQHPILKRFISNFAGRGKELSRPYGGNIRAVVGAGVLLHEDPLQLTGPEAITLAAKEWSENEADLRWNALTGLADGGRSKPVGDTIIFPITAFRYVLYLGVLYILPTAIFWCRIITNFGIRIAQEGEDLVAWAQNLSLIPMRGSCIRGRLENH